MNEQKLPSGRELFRFHQEAAAKKPSGRPPKKKYSVKMLLDADRLRQSIAAMNDLQNALEDALRGQPDLFEGYIRPALDTAICSMTCHMMDLKPKDAIRGGDRAEWYNVVVLDDDNVPVKTLISFSAAEDAEALCDAMGWRYEKDGKVFALSVHMEGEENG